MTKFKPEELTGNAFDMIGRTWMLITAEKDGKINSMTASWGGMGVMWGKPSAFCVVRPQRYTFEFMEAAEIFTLSFLPEKYRPALNIMGTKSGRDCDKIAEAGLTPVKLESSAWTFKEAETAFVTRKKYAQFLKEDCFVDPGVCAQWYPRKDYHKLFIGEILYAVKPE